MPKGRRAATEQAASTGRAETRSRPTPRNGSVVLPEARRRRVVRRDEVDGNSPRAERPALVTFGRSKAGQRWAGCQRRLPSTAGRRRRARGRRGHHSGHCPVRRSGHGASGRFRGRRPGTLQSCSTVCGSRSSPTPQAQPELSPGKRASRGRQQPRQVTADPLHTNLEFSTPATTAPERHVVSFARMDLRPSIDHLHASRGRRLARPLPGLFAIGATLLLGSEALHVAFGPSRQPSSASST